MYEVNEDVYSQGSSWEGFSRLKFTSGCNQSAFNKTLLKQFMVVWTETRLPWPITWKYTKISANWNVSISKWQKSINLNFYSSTEGLHNRYISNFLSSEWVTFDDKWHPIINLFLTDFSLEHLAVTTPCLILLWFLKSVYIFCLSFYWMKVLAPYLIQFLLMCLKPGLNCVFFSFSGYFPRLEISISLWSINGAGERHHLITFLVYIETG